MEGAAEISPDSLVSLLSRQDQSTLVLDCRPFMAFNKGHVVHAVNVHCPPILKRRSGGFVALENIVPDPVHRERLQKGQYDTVVVYDQATRDLSMIHTDSNLFSVMKSLIQQVQVRCVLYLVGGYDVFSEDCPLLCATQQFSLLSAGRPDLQLHAHDDQPVEILPFLFLGNIRHSASHDLLQRLGITALVNVSTSCPNHFPHLFRYLHIAVNDSASEDLASWFPQANLFIDEVKADGGKVLVHCHAGRSRSATICLAYLMTTLSLSLDQAFEHVRSRREVIDPNLNFMRQLQDYEQHLAGRRVLCSPSPLTLHPTFLQPPPRTPREVPVPISLSCVETSLLHPPALSESLVPPPSPRTPREAPAPISFSCVESSLLPPALSESLIPPPSPATATDIQFFFSSEDFPLTSGSLARTPEIPLPS